MTTYLGSAFSLQMIPSGGTITVEPVEFNRSYFIYVEWRHSWAPGGHYNRVESPDFTSVVGHEGTAKALSTLIGHPVLLNRQAIVLTPDDALYVAQPTGQRIKYGEELDFPELKFFRVTFHQCPGLDSYSDEKLERELKYRSGEVEAEAELKSLASEPTTSPTCPQCELKWDGVTAMKIALFGGICQCGFSVN